MPSVLVDAETYQTLGPAVGHAIVGPSYSSRSRASSLQEFARFYESEFPLVYRACFAMTQDPEAATDAAQEAFSRAYSRWKRLRTKDWKGGWVMTTAMNISRRQLRHEDVQTTPVDEMQPAEPASTRVDILNALRTLPPRRRQAIVLHYLTDLPVASVAELMDLSEGTVKAHLMQGRKHLKRILDGEGPDDEEGAGNG